MTKDEINKKIYSLQTEEEIINFVKERIERLENESYEITVGQNYTDKTFKEYISSKTHYKPAERIGNDECPDLVYDDIIPYVELIKEIKQQPFYNEMTLFTSIFFTIHEYLPNTDGMGFSRAWAYMNNKGRKVSIKEIRENECAFCSEKTGLAHNMFKFLGIDSEVAIGYRNDERHAYNIVYPRGYNNEPMVIYDVSHFVNFNNAEKKFSLGYFKSLNKEEYNKLMNGVPVKADLTRTEKNYRNLYKFDDSFIFKGEEPVYIIGLNRKQEIDEEELYYRTHLENGVESVMNKR